MSQSFSILTLEELATWLERLARQSALAVRLLGSLSIFIFQIKLRITPDLKDEQAEILKEEFHVVSVSMKQWVTSKKFTNTFKNCLRFSKKYITHASVGKDMEHLTLNCLWEGSHFNVRVDIGILLK
jgi:hypothetical protein